MFRTYIVPHLPSSVPDTGFFSHPEIKRWVECCVVVPGILNHSPYPEGENRDCPCALLDINCIFTQLCNQECIITYSLP